MGWIFKDDPALIVPLLTNILGKVDYQAFHNIAFTLHGIVQKGIPSHVSTEDLKEVIKERLVQKPKLDHNDAEDLLEFVFEEDLTGFLAFIKNRLKIERESSIRSEFEAIPFNGFNFFNKLVKTETHLEDVFRLAYELEKEHHSLQFSLAHLLNPVLYKSFNNEKAYIILSCKKLIDHNDYKAIHSELWWRLSKLQIDENTKELFSKAMLLAETSGLLYEVSGIVWSALTPREWSGSLREIPPQFSSALEFANKFKAEFPPGESKLLVERIEKGILRDIEGIEREHEEILYER